MFAFYERELSGNSATTSGLSINQVGRSARSVVGGLQSLKGWSVVAHVRALITSPCSCGGRQIGNYVRVERGATV